MDPEKNRRKKLDLELKKLSLALMPSSERQRSGNMKAQQIFDYLRQNCRTYRVDRCYIGGSSGKKTAATGTPDFDLVIFVNDIEPSFQSTVIPKFVEILSKMPRIIILGHSKCSIQLTYDQFEIDLLPAPNYCNRMAQKPGGRTLAAYQALGVLQKIDEDPQNNYYYYSSGLAETALGFVRDPNDFMQPGQQKGNATAFFHDLVRLCKHWSSNVKIKGRGVSGGSTLVELIAIKAGLREQSKKWGSSLSVSLSLLDAFEEFLTLIESFEELEIEFPFDPLGPIRNKIDWQPRNLPVKQKPYVLEPANPFNNMALIPSEAKKQFKKAAKVTLVKLTTCDPFLVNSVAESLRQPKADDSRCKIC